MAEEPEARAVRASGDFHSARQTPPGPERDPRRRTRQVRSASRVTLDRALPLLDLASSR